MCCQVDQTAVYDDDTFTVDNASLETPTLESSIASSVDAQHVPIEKGRTTKSGSNDRVRAWPQLHGQHNHSPDADKFAFTHHSMVKSPWNHEPG